MSHTSRSRAASREERGSGGLGTWSEGFDLRFGIARRGEEGQHSWSARMNKGPLWIVAGPHTNPLTNVLFFFVPPSFFVPSA